MLSKIRFLIISWNQVDKGLLYFFYVFFLYLKKSPILGIFKFIVMFFYSYYISYALVGFSLLPRVVFTNSLFRVKVDRHKTAEVKSEKKIMLRFESWGNASKTMIVLSESSHLVISGPFTIGDGCKIQLEAKACLRIGGDDLEQTSGITCNSIILCSNHINIGRGVIISWNCYIADSSQHKIWGQLKIKPVIIGDGVWVSEGVSIGPGSSVGFGSIIGAKSLLSGLEYPNNSLLVGCPARVVKTDIHWSR